MDYLSGGNFISEKSMPATKPAAPFSINQDFEIPSIPLVLIRIIQTLDEDKGSARELEELIMHDPALAARILRLSNSAFESGDWNQYF
jgi:HD-like signal output (HDOD) protein